MPRTKNMVLRNKILARLREHPKAKTADLMRDFSTTLSFVNMVRREKLLQGATDKDDPDAWFCQPCALHVKNPHTCSKIADTRTWQIKEDDEARIAEERERKEFAQKFVEEREARIAATHAAENPLAEILDELAHDDEQRKQHHDHELPTPVLRQETDQVAGPGYPESVTGEIVDDATNEQIHRPVVALSDIPPLSVRQALIALSRAIRSAEEYGQAPSMFADEAQNPAAASQWVTKINGWITAYHTRLQERVSTES